MALKNYHLRSPSIIIEVDDRDPNTSWANHIKRTKDPSRGGIDIVAKRGTPIYARTSGRMYHYPNDGGAGNSSQFAHDDNPGWRDVFSHLSQYVGKSGDHFEAGEIVGYTGNSGGVAAHLHWHLLDPNHVRRNPWNYFTPVVTPVGNGPTTPVSPSKGADIMARNIRNTKTGYTATVAPGFLVHLDAGGLGAAAALYGEPVQLNDENFTVALYLNMIPVELHGKTGVRYIK